MPTPPENLRDFKSLTEIMVALRGPDGCPWDKEQTHRSLVKYAVEEAHEFAEAVEGGDPEEICDELGDILLQVVLNAEVARQSGDFTIEDVIEKISEKMVRRHPHVFANQTVDGKEEVITNWSEIKAAEKASKPKAKERFDVPLSLPALMRSSKIGSKTKKLNFDWESADQVLDKVEEELRETKEAIQDFQKDPQRKSELQAELGDLLFSVAQLARHCEVDPEQALRECNTRFETRFFHMKNRIENDGAQLTELSDEKLEAEWQKTKAELKKKS